MTRFQQWFLSASPRRGNLTRYAIPFEDPTNGWIDPSGNFHPVPYGSTHHDWAKEQGLGGMKGAFAHGWGRVVPYGNDLMVHNDVMRPNPHQRAALADIAMMNHMDSVVHGSEYEPLFWRTIWDKSDHLQRSGWPLMFARPSEDALSDMDKQTYSKILADKVRPNLAQHFGGQIPPEIEPHLQALEQHIGSGDLMQKSIRAAKGDPDRVRDVVSAFYDPNHAVYRVYDPAAHGSFSDRFQKHFYFASKYGIERRMKENAFGAPGEGQEAAGSFGDMTKQRKVGDSFAGAVRPADLRTNIPADVRDLVGSPLYPQVPGNRQKAIGKMVGRSGSTVNRIIRDLAARGEVDAAIRRPKIGQEIMNHWLSGKTQQEILEMKGPDGRLLYKPNTVAKVFFDARKRGNPDAPPPMREHAPEEHIAKVVELASQGKNAREISATTGLPLKFVWATMIRKVPKEQRVQSPRKGLLKTDHAKRVVELLQQGKSTAEIQAETGLANDRIAAIKYRNKHLWQQPQNPEQLQRWIGELFQFAKPRPGIPGNLGQAVAVARSRQALAVAKAVSVALTRLGADPHRVTRAVLNTGGRSVPAAVASVYSPTTDANALAAAGWMGMMHHSPGVVAFRSLPGGPDRLHRISFNGPANELMNRLASVGAYTHTLIPTRSGFTALVYDRGGKMTGPLMQSGLDFATAEGHGVTLNGQDELRAGTRAPEQPR